MTPNQEVLNHQQILGHLVDISAKVGGIEQARVNQDARIDKLGEILSSHMEREEEIQKSLIQTMNKFEERINTIPNEVHLKHHEAMDRFLQTQQVKQEFWCEVKKKVAQNGVWAFVAGIGMVIWYAFTTFIKNGGN